MSKTVLSNTYLFLTKNADGKYTKCNKCCAEGPHVPIRKNQCAASMIRKATDAWNERHYAAPPGTELPKGKTRYRDELGAKKFKEV